MDASELCAPRLNAKEVLTPQRSGNFFFLVADGTVTIFGREQRLRASTLTWDRPEQGEEQEIVRGETDGSSSTPRQDSTWYDGEVKSDFWSISGDFIYRHHVELRVQLYMPKDVRGVKSASGQDSSFGVGAVVICLGVVRMEQEVQDRVPVEVGREEQGVGETHGKEQGEEQREQTINQPLIMDDHEYGVMRHKHVLEPLWCDTS